MVGQVNAALTSSPDHIKITTKLLNNQCGEPSEDYLNTGPITKDTEEAASRLVGEEE